MKVKMDLSALKRTKWHEYLVRFVFGGLVTTATGWVAKQFGPQVGGLFLAFPAIFPASVTLVQKHEKEQKEQDGKDGKEMSKMAAGVDAAGAAMGSLGLLAFGLVVWKLAPSLAAWLCLLTALVCWAVASVLVWTVRQKI